MALTGLPHRRVTSLLDSERNWEWLRANGESGFSAHLELESGTSVGDSTLSVATGEVPAAAQGLVAIGVFTTDCELRRVTNISGSTITVSPALSKGHASGSTVIFFDTNTVPASWWGAKGDNSTDDSDAIQAALRTIDAASLFQTMSTITLHGAGRIYRSSQPIMVPNHSSLAQFNIWAKSDYAPDDHRGAMLMTYRGTVKDFTATAADDTFTVSGSSGLSDPGQVVFKGDSLPGGLVSGKVYFVKSRPTASTFTISETAGGSTFNVTADGSGEMYPSPQALCRLYLNDVFLYGGNYGTSINGIRANFQQPAFLNNLRTSGFTGIGYIASGQQAVHFNFEATDCGIGYAIDDGSFMWFFGFDVEQNQVQFKVLDNADSVFGSAGEGAYACTFDGVHLEMEGTQAGFLFEGKTAEMTFNNVQLSTGNTSGVALLENNTGGAPTDSGYTFRNLRIIGTAGNTLIDDVDRGYTRDLLVGTEHIEEISAPAALQDTSADDEGRHEIRFHEDGYIRYGAMNDYRAKLALRNDAGYHGDLVLARDRSGNDGSGFNRDGYLFTRLIAAPADADIYNSEAMIWFDPTPGAAKLKIKAKNSAGTVVTGEIALT